MSKASIPGTAAMRSAFSTASGVSIIATSSVAALSAGMASFAGTGANPNCG